MPDLETQLRRYASDVMDRVGEVSADDVLTEGGTGRARWRSRPLATAAAIVVVLAVGAGVAALLVDARQSGVTIGPGEQASSADPLPSPSARPGGVGQLPSPLVVSMPEVAVLDPATGAVLETTDAPTGEGLVPLSLAPDGSAVYHHELWTGCATRLWRTPLDGGQPEMLGPGFLPEVSSDGSTLAYVDYSPCVSDPARRLVLRDLADGRERTVALDQPAGERADVHGLSWSPDGRHIAVEVGYWPQQPDGSDEPSRYDIHLVPVSTEQDITSAPVLEEPDDGVEWRLGDYRGAGGGLLVVEVCCDIPPDQPRRGEHADVFRLVEVDPESGERLDTLFERRTAIRLVRSDETGEHILYFEGSERERALKRFHGGQSYTIKAAGDWGPHFADWGPTPARPTDKSDGPAVQDRTHHRADLDGDGHDDSIEVDTTQHTVGTRTTAHFPVVTVQLASGPRLSLEFDEVTTPDQPWIAGHVELSDDGRDQVLVVTSGETAASLALVTVAPETTELHHVAISDLDNDLLAVGNGAGYAVGLTCRDDGLLESWRWTGEADHDSDGVLERRFYELVDNGRHLQLAGTSRQTAPRQQGRLDCPQAIDPGA